MATLSDFKPLILPYAQGCADPLLEQKIKDTIDDFCQESGIWQKDLSISVTEDDTAYTLSPPAGTQIVRGLRLKRSDEAEVTGFIYDPMNDQLLLDSKPGSDATWTLTVALKPKKNDTAIYKDALIDDYGDIIASGVLSLLMMMPGQPFSNPEMANVYSNFYLTGRKKAKIQANKLLNKSQSLWVQPRVWV
jgi:hypothetical protein